MKHRNSQKRIHIKNGVYFITTSTKHRYPFFEKDELCELFVLQLESCIEMFKINLFGYKINPDHVHLLIGIGEENVISNIMFSLKKQFAHNVNRILGYNKINECTCEYDITHEGEQALVRLHTGIDNFIKQYNFSNHNIPKFKWQKSYHDHYIRDELDFYNYVQYIQNQWIKHGLKENKYCYTNEVQS